MRIVVILIVSIIGVNSIPALAQTRDWFHNPFANTEPAPMPELIEMELYLDQLGYDGTELISSISEGRIKNVEHLISTGVDVNTTTYSGITALMEASEGGHKKIAELLISKGADVNAVDRNNSGTTLM